MTKSFTLILQELSKDSNTGTDSQGGLGIDSLESISGISADVGDDSGNTDSDGCANGDGDSRGLSGSDDSIGGGVRGCSGGSRHGRDGQASSGDNRGSEDLHFS